MNNTEVSVEKDWLRLLSNEGYEVYLKTFVIEGRKKTVAIDNFSVSVVSVLDYDLDEVNLDLFEWENVWDKSILNFSSYEEGLSELKKVLSEEDYKDFKELYDVNFAD